jgi:serine/threonine-protein kinase
MNDSPSPDLNKLDYHTRCDITKLIASGGMGSVYLAEQRGAYGFKKVVAIKTIRNDLLESESTRDMFISEAKLVADLIHENIAQVYNLGQSEDVTFIQMEYIKGITLSRLIKKHRMLDVIMPPDLAAFICSRVARALSYAHAKSSHDGESLGIVHRDVTPSNIMIDSLGVIKLTDFGIAKAITMGTPDEKKVLMGKYPYMSPEQVRLEGTDGRSDLFALGVVLFEMLTMRKLLPVKTRDSLLELFKEGHFAEPKHLNPKVPDKLNEIVMSLLSIDKECRPTTARKLVLSLEKYMYSKGYGPTNEKLSIYMRKVFARP